MSKTQWRCLLSFSSVSTLEIQYTMYTNIGTKAYFYLGIDLDQQTVIQVILYNPNVLLFSSFINLIISFAMEKFVSKISLFILFIASW